MLEEIVKQFDNQEEQQNKTFTQADVDTIVEGRLAREKESARATIEGMKAEYRRQVGEAPDITTYINEESAKRSGDDLRKEQLQTLLRDSAKMNRMAIDEPAKYKLLRQEFIRFGLLDPARKPERQPGPLFHKPVR